MKKIIGLSLLVSLFFISCKKDTPAVVCTLNSTSLLGSYKTTSVIYKADATTAEIDLFPLYDACQKDDLLTFVTGGMYASTEGATACTPANNSNGTWSLTGSTITLDGTDDASVSDFSCSGFKVKITDALTGETYTLTLVKQ